MIKTGDVVRFKGGTHLLTVKDIETFNLGKMVYYYDEVTQKTGTTSEDALEIVSTKEINKIRKTGLHIGKITISNVQLYIGIAILAFTAGISTSEGFRRLNNLDLIKNGSYITYANFNKIINSDYVSINEYNYIKEINNTLKHIINANNKKENLETLLKIEELETKKDAYSRSIIQLDSNDNNFEANKLKYENEIRKLNADLKQLYISLN